MVCEATISVILTLCVYQYCIYLDISNINRVEAERRWIRLYTSGLVG